MDNETTQVVNIHESECDVYIGRAGNGKDGYFGNPVRFDKRCPLCQRIHRDTVTGRFDLLACYDKYFKRRMIEDRQFFTRVLDLYGKRLGCFCKPKPCHGDVIVEWLENNTAYLNRAESYLSELAAEDSEELP